MGEWDDMQAIDLGTDKGAEPEGDELPGVNWGPHDTESWRDVEITLRFRMFGKKSQAVQALKGVIRALRYAGHDVRATSYQMQQAAPPQTLASPGITTPPVQGGD